MYHLTDGLITESFSCQIPVYPLHFPLIRTRRVKPLFLQEPPYRFSLSALITTCFKGIIDQLCRHAFLLELRPDFPAALHSLPAADKVLRVPGIIEISERSYIFHRSVDDLRRIQAEPPSRI